MQRILVVEDDPGTRWLVTQILGRNGYTTVEAENGLQALEVLEQDSGFCMILSDIRMAGMDGLELLNVVKSRWAEIPMVMVSVHAMVDLTHQAAEQGASGYLLKPFTQQQLLAAVNQALRQRQF